MRTNLFTIQVLGLIISIPVFLLLEFRQKKITLAAKEKPVKIVKINKPVQPCNNNLVMFDEGVSQTSVLFHF
ncbi:MAG: hypothetical protein QM791_01325 [Ferruginibacter sp.]